MCYISNSLLMFFFFVFFPLISSPVPVPDPSPQLETFKKKDVIEILSHKKAYNACEYHTPVLPLFFFFSSQNVVEFAA